MRVQCTDFAALGALGGADSGVVLPVRPLGGRHGRVCGTWWAGFRNIGGAVSGTAQSGAAGSRTRVPRPRCSGLYVRRSRSISDRGAPRPSSSADLATCGVPRRPVAQASRWSLVDVDPVPVRGVRGGSSRVLCREGELVVRVGTYRVRRFLSRSRRHPRHAPLASALATVETMSAPGVGGAHRRCAVVKESRCAAREG
jgi:hypothetical protein